MRVAALHETDRQEARLLPVIFCYHAIDADRVDNLRPMPGHLKCATVATKQNRRPGDRSAVLFAPGRRR